MGCAWGCSRGLLGSSCPQEKTKKASWGNLGGAQEKPKTILRSNLPGCEGGSWEEKSLKRRPKCVKKRCQDALKDSIMFLGLLDWVWVGILSIWDRCRDIFSTVLGMVLKIGEIAKNVKNIRVFNDFSRFGGSTFRSFLQVFQSISQDLLLNVLGAVLGTIF